ncbi:MAG TPA: type II toxin-antitoxin system antitoxin, RelB/DinJ family [Alphaproteobacteria bacterium]|nr:type II toxin-antitoxin system antitoxin, RelB/DinJ family [Alphaproteobacteria bacterium]
MAKSAVINIRVEEKQKENIRRILDKLGVSITDAVRIFFAKVENEKGLPFDVRIPSKRLKKSIIEVESGKTKRIQDVKSFLSDV